MTKRTLFTRTIRIIWVIVLFRLSLSLSVFWDNLLKIWYSMLDFKFTFSFSHFLNLAALCILLYFIRNWIYFHEEKVQASTKERYYNTLRDHDSFLVKLFLVVFPMSIILFSVLAFIKLPQIPEILLLISFFTFIGWLEFIKKPEDPDNSVNNTYLFTDEPIKNYSQLNDFQKTEVDQLKSILDAGLDEYLSIALNGSWGSGKTSILKGLKNLLEKGDPESETFISNYEVFELNLWQARTHENAIEELDRLFTELFSKVYLKVSSNDLAFFSLLSGSENSWLSTTFKTLLGDNDPMPTSRIRIEKKLQQVLNHLNKQKLVILIDDLDRLPEQYLNGFLKIICYVTGLKNIVTISGINREKILSQLQKTEVISIWADGVNAGAKIAKKRNNDESRGNDILRREATSAIESEEKKEFHFNQFDNESFISKIFTVQRELVNSNYHIKDFVDIYKENIYSFRVKITFKDKEKIIKEIIDFTGKNNDYFNTYRDIKLFLNEVFVYLVGFGGKKQSEINISDYIEIDSILAMAWAKIIYPDFYKEVKDYVTPFIYRKQDISNDERWRTTYKFRDFIEKQYLLNDEGLELIVNTRAHRKIKTVFDQLDGKNDLTNPDSAIRYFHPIIEPYEITLGEFTNLFKKPIAIKTISEFVQIKWNLHPVFVFKDFVKRVKLREFKLSERLNSALAIMDLILEIDPSIKKINSETNLNLWKQIISLLEHGTSSHKYKDANQMILQGDFAPQLLELWEKKYKLIENADLKSSNERLYQLNLFYRFFIVSNYEDDTSVETAENLKFLLDKIAIQRFEKNYNSIACLLYSYDISGDYWSGEKHHLLFSFSFNDALPIYLKSLFSLIDINAMPPSYILKDCKLLFDGLKFSHDTILFEAENLEKFIYLFKKKHLDFTLFIDCIKDRTEKCNLMKEHLKIYSEKLLAYIASESDYYQQGYEDTIQKFFKTDGL